jgi:UDP-glucose 4-epimerase
LRVLVTGGAGFIGSHLTEELLRKGDDVTVLDNMESGSHSNLKGLDVDILEGDCLSLSEMDLNPEAIYHLGIHSSSPMYRMDPFLTGRAVNEAIAVFELAKRNKAPVVYASSSSLYNSLEPPHREDMVIQVTDYYTEARLAVERIAELYNRLYHVRSDGMRFFSVYGPKEEAKKQYANMISQFIWDMKADKQPIIYGDGTQSRDFTYVKDVVRALRIAMKSDYHGILNVGSGQSFSFNEIIAMLNKKLAMDVQPIYVPNPIKNYVAHTLADTSKALNILRFRASYSLDRGIDEILNIQQIRP